MKNPLRKRYIRELKQDFGKYLVIFLFLIMLICLVSGYLVVADSIETSFYNNFDKYNVEDGHITFNMEPDQEVLDNIEEKAELKFYELKYAEEDIEGNGATLRIYKDRTEVDKVCLMTGEMPVEKDEIALDRAFANNNDIAIGDEIELTGKEYKVTGFVALVDYGCLFENESDMMFNAVNFGVAIVSDEGFDFLDSEHVKENYAYIYDIQPKDDDEAKECSDDLQDVLKDVIEDYDTQEVEDALAEGKILEESDLLSVDGYQARYNSKAVNYCMDDMGSDKPMYMVFDYIVTVIVAFVFAVTISNTISQEAGVIGTLRASGYTRGELLRHYIFLPIVISLIAAVIGNILGYTVLTDFYKQIFYGSFSLATYEPLFNEEAFIDTTVIPLIIMIVVNFCVLNSKLKIKPINFLRRDLNKKKKRRAFLLNKKIPFMHRFRIRIFAQNISAYITLAIGIFFGGTIAVFGWMFGPMLSDYADLIKSSEISDYQYILIREADTDTDGAEKYCVSSLDTIVDGYLTDEVSIYGIEEESSYILKDIPEDEVLLSNGFAAKFGLEEGDTVTLKEQYGTKTYDFKVGGTYKYDAALAVFMNRNEFNDMFDKDEDYFNGYFTDEEIEDIDDADVATIITEEDLTKVSEQLQVSMGDFMSVFQYFGMVMFLLLMYLMTKQIIEKNMQSIAMTKILGFRDREIAGLYLVMTSIVVVVALFVSVPIISEILRICFEDYIYTEISGYIPYIVSDSCYVKMVVTGVICYLVVGLFMMIKIGRIKKSEALKNAE